MVPSGPYSEGRDALRASALANRPERAYIGPMHTRNPLFDEVAKLGAGALGLAQAAGEEARTAVRAQVDRLVADMDLVRRDEHDALRAEIAALRSEIASLRTGETRPTQDLG